MGDGINEIHIFCRDFEEFFIRYAEQIGQGQVFVETDDLLPVETPVDLVIFVVYEDLVFFRSSGIISYVIKPDQADTGPDKAPGMGVKIEDLDEEIRDFFITLIKFQLKSELSRMFTT